MLLGWPAVEINALNPPYHQWPELFPALQAGVLEGAAASGAKLVAMENLYMYGPTGGRALTEDLPYAASTSKGRVRAEMSQKLWRRTGRPGAGCDRTSIGFLRARVVTSAAGRQVFGRAVEGKSAQVAGDPINLIPTRTHPTSERDWPSSATGRGIGPGMALAEPRYDHYSRVRANYLPGGWQAARIQAASKILLRTLGLFDSALRQTIEMLYEFEEPFIVDHSRFARAFGNHATPLREAIGQTVRWYRDERPAAG